MAAVTEKLCFYNLGGEVIALKEEPSSVAEAKKQLAQAYNVKYPSQILLFLLDGIEVKDTDDLPCAGSIQVQKRPAPEGTWSRVVWDANNLDEEVLYEALSKAFPPPLHEIDFEDDPVPAWSPEHYWGSDETWAKWTSGKMQQATIRAVGSWANYWDFANMADTYGYWMVEAPYRSKQQSLEMYVSNVRHWRSLLHDLDASFVAIKERTKGMNVAEIWEIAAAELLKYHRTKLINTSFKYGLEAWYWPFIQVLEWFADFADLEVPSRSCIGLAPDHSADGFFKMMLTPSGRNGVFSSYTVRADGAKLFAEKMAEHYGITFESFNATAEWLSQRPLLANIPAKSLAGASPCQEDSHFRYICSIDFSRNPERAERLKDALVLVRCDVIDDRPLTVEMLCRWQTAVLGLPTELRIRSTDAYAKAGRERYPHWTQLKASLEEKLSDVNAESGMPAVAPEVRAARAYLDVCFFHPFDDGNARLARLVLDYVLTKAGLCLQDVDGDLFTRSRMACDQVEAKLFVETIQKNMAPLGLKRDDDLMKWSTHMRDASLLKLRKRKCDGTDYDWFDCVSEFAKLDREPSHVSNPASVDVADQS